MSIHVIVIIGQIAHIILTLLLNFIQRIHILHGSTHTHTHTHMHTHAHTHMHTHTHTHTHTHAHTHLLENGANVG